jgi:hypothetical protein
MERLSMRVDMPLCEVVFRFGSDDEITAALRSYLGGSVGRVVVEKEAAGENCTFFRFGFLDGYHDQSMLTTEHMKVAFQDLLSETDVSSLVALRFFRLYYYATD